MADTNMLEIAKNLRAYNRWRRGEDEEMPMPAPRDIGAWLDAAADALEDLEPLRKRADLWKGERDAIAEDADRLREQKEELIQRAEQAVAQEQNAQQCVVLNRELGEARESVTAYAHLLAVACSDLEQKNGQLWHATWEANYIEEAIREFEAVKCELLRHVDRLRKKLDEAEAERDDSEAIRAKLTAVYQADLARVTAERDQFAECVNKSESVAERGNLVGEIQRMEAEIKRLEHENDGLERRRQYETDLVCAAVIESNARGVSFGSAELCARVDEIRALRARVAELEEKAERYRLTTLRQDARVAELEAEIERWRTATAKLRDGAEEAGRVANEQVARAEARVKELESENARYVEAINKSESMAERGNLVGELHALRAANAELAGALRALSQAVHAKIQVQGADGNYVLSMDVASADRILARHAAGEPAQEACGGRCGDPLCNLSTEGELMREPAKHPDTERLDHLVTMASRGSKMGVFIPGGTTRETLEAFIDGDAARQQGGAE